MAQDKGNHGHRRQDAVAYLEGLVENSPAGDEIP